MSRIQNCFAQVSDLGSQTIIGTDALSCCPAVWQQWQLTGAELQSVSWRKPPIQKDTQQIPCRGHQDASSLAWFGKCFTPSPQSLFATEQTYASVFLQLTLCLCICKHMCLSIYTQNICAVRLLILIIVQYYFV